MNSHYAPWAAAWPTNNYGTAAESIVTGNIDDTMFDQAVRNALDSVTAALFAAQSASEPCEVNFNDTCTVLLGIVNFCVQ